MDPNFDMSTVTSYYVTFQGVEYGFSEPFPKEFPAELVELLTQRLGYLVEAKTLTATYLLLSTKTPPDRSMQNFCTQLLALHEELGIPGSIRGSVQLGGEVDELPEL